MHLLVAEADASLAEFLRNRFQQENYRVDLVASGKELSERTGKPKFDLIVLDLNLPGIAGSPFLNGLQRLWPGTPVILLSSETAVEERVRGLNAGADDFLVKPFAVAELVARVQAVLRRRARPAHDVFLYEDLEIFRVSHRVSRNVREIELSPREYSLLEFLLRNPGRPVSRTAIIEEVWGMDGAAITNVVDVYINYLRRKLDGGADRPLIRTVHGVGYQIGGNYQAA
jgi:two-component system, OmpR family, copper resistance phosphate regulon response regulator CusR